jgi:RND family efflux transporter MFP subunit
MDFAVRFGVAGSISLLLLAACGSSTTAGAPPPPEVTTAKVIEKRVKDWDEFTGRFQAIDTIEVRPRVSGYIDQVAFTEGKIVKQGDLLFQIDPRPYQADYDHAKANLALAKAQFDLAQIEANRIQRLTDTGAVARDELDRRVSTLNQQRANVQSQQATLDTAALNLGFTRVMAPIGGRASRAEVTRGNLVSGGNNGGTLLTTLVSIDPIYVYFEGDENTYLRYGQLALKGERPSSRDTRNPVRVALANEERATHEGYVDFVDNAVNPQTGTIRARAVLANKDGAFTPGLFARVELVGSAEYDAILIEDRAVGTDQNQKFVLVVGPDNKTEYRKVTLGRMIDGLRAVREGLRPGDVIVVNGLQRVRPGIVVAPKLQTMGATDVAAHPEADEDKAGTASTAIAKGKASAAQSN